MESSKVTERFRGVFAGPENFSLSADIVMFQFASVAVLGVGELVGLSFRMGFKGEIGLGRAALVHLGVLSTGNRLLEANVDCVTEGGAKVDCVTEGCAKVEVVAALMGVNFRAGAGPLPVGSMRGFPWKHADSFFASTCG